MSQRHRRRTASLGMACRHSGTWGFFVPARRDAYGSLPLGTRSFTGAVSNTFLYSCPNAPSNSNKPNPIQDLPLGSGENGDSIYLDSRASASTRSTPRLRHRGRPLHSSQPLLLLAPSSRQAGRFTQTECRQPREPAQQIHFCITSFFLSTTNQSITKRVYTYTVTGLSIQSKEQKTGREAITALRGNRLPTQSNKSPTR